MSENSNDRKLKVIVISGGGVYGIIPCVFLNLLNKEDLSKIDVFGGTSAGGIVSIHLAHYLDPGKLYSDFKNNVGNFFQQSLLNIISPFHPKYNSTGIQSSLQKILPFPVSSCKKQFVIPSFSFKSMQPVIFHNLDKSFYYMKAWKIARSTSAAPAYFLPFSQNILIDGGILQDFPIVTTASMICKYYNKKPSDLDVFAIGTGVVDINLNRKLKNVNRYTKLDWARELMPIITTGGNKLMSQLWGENMGFNYFKIFNPVVIDGIMDNVSKINLIEQKCELYTGQFVKQWKKFIEY